MTRVPKTGTFGAMRLLGYADAIGGMKVVADGTGLPLSTLHRIANGEVACRVDNAKRIVDFSRRHPAPSGETVRYEDLVPENSLAEAPAA